jgi:hypothetical protein
MDKKVEAIKAAIVAATENDYVTFKEHMDVVVLATTDEHAGVQAYREDMDYYAQISDALNSVKPATPPED